MTRKLKDRKEPPQGGCFLGGKGKISKHPAETTQFNTRLFPQ